MVTLYSSKYDPITGKTTQTQSESNTPLNTNLSSGNSAPIQPAGYSVGTGTATDPNTTTTTNSGGPIVGYSSGSGVPLYSLSTATAPTNVANINQTSSAQIPQTSVSSGNVAPAVAATAGVAANIDARMAADAQAAQDKKDSDALVATQTASTTGMFDWLNKQPSAGEVRAGAYEDIGYNPREYFDKQKAGIAEIGSLTEDFNAAVAARDAQIAKTQDVMGSMNFINNQTAQITRNAAPVLNQKSANINAKASTLQALQGNFAEAQKYVNQAVDDMTADKKAKVDAFTMFYTINQDSIDRLDSKYKDALNRATDFAVMEHEEARADAQYVGDLSIQYPNIGIDITKDTPETAAAKVSRSGAGVVGGSGSGTKDKVLSLTDVERAQDKYDFLEVNYGTTEQGLANVANMVWDEESQEAYKNNIDGFGDYIDHLLTGLPQKESPVEEPKKSWWDNIVDFGKGLLK